MDFPDINGLRKLADAGKTILVTIHQPSLEAFERFDAVAVIARDESTKQVGRLAWFGRAFPDSITFFEPQLSGSAPPTSVDGLLRGLSKRPVAEWVRQWESSVAKSIWVDRRASAHAGALPPRSRRLPHSTAPFTHWLTLVKRMIAVKVADGWGTAVLFAQAPIVGLLIAAVFSKVVRSTPTPETWPKIGVNMATTLFVTALAAIWFGCSSMAREIVTEWPIYRRERMVGLSIGAYVASKMTVLLGIAAIQCLLLLAIVAPACRIDSPWLWVFTMLYAAALAGGALGLLISATLRTTEAASGILPVLLLPMIVLGGILVPLADLPALTQPLAAAMPSRWAFEGLVVPEATLRPQIRLGGAPAQRPEPSPAAVDELDPEPPEASPIESPPPVPEVTLPSPDSTTGPEWPNAFRLAGNGGGHPFIRPGRRKIVEKLEEAAGQAKQELEKAKKMLEEKAQKIQADMRAEAEKKLADAKAEFEKKSAESAAKMKEEIEAKVAEAKAAAQKESEAAAERMKTEMELRVREAQEQARRESAEARDQVRQEFEAKTATAKAEAQKESEATAARMRTEIEAKMEEAQAAAKRQSEEAGNAAKADIESRVKSIDAELEKKTREASERLEGKLREMEKKIESERARMNDSLESLRAGAMPTLVPPGADAPAATAPQGHPPVDMAERFFARETWRSGSTVPLAVLLGMFAVGIAGTGLALRFRDSSGR